MLQVREEPITSETSLVVAAKNTSLPVVRKQLAKLLPQVCGADICTFMHTYSRRLHKGAGHCAGNLWHAQLFVCWHWQVVKH